MQLRRETSVLLNRVWQFSAGYNSSWQKRRLTNEIRREFISCMCLTPLLQTSLRSRVSSQLVITDASEH
eukprot:1375077-Karenia_brevis.AAC.1